MTGARSSDDGPRQARVAETAVSREPGEGAAGGAARSRTSLDRFVVRPQVLEAELASRRGRHTLTQAYALDQRLKRERLKRRVAAPSLSRGPAPAPRREPS